MVTKKITVNDIKSMNARAIAPDWIDFQDIILDDTQASHRKENESYINNIRKGIDSEKYDTDDEEIADYYFRYLSKTASAHNVVDNSQYDRFIDSVIRLANAYYSTYSLTVTIPFLADLANEDQIRLLLKAADAQLSSAPRLLRPAWRNISADLNERIGRDSSTSDSPPPDD